MEKTNITPLQTLWNRKNGIFDQETLALAIDGGGAKSLLGIAALEELDKSGMLDLFDMYSGASGGAINATVAMSKQFVEATDIYSNLGKNGVMAWGRLSPFSREWPVIDTARLGELIVETPVDMKKIDSTNIRLEVGLTNLSSMTAESVNALHQLDDCPSDNTRAEKLVDLLMVSSHFPLLAGKPPMKDGSVLADGGLSWRSSADIAFSAGATKVIELNNGPKTVWKRTKTSYLFENAVAGWIAKHTSLASAKQYRRFVHEQRHFMNNRDSDPNHSTNVSYIRPAEVVGNLPSVVENDKARLKTALVAGRVCVQKLLEDLEAFTPQEPIVPATL